VFFFFFFPLRNFAFFSTKKWRRKFWIFSKFFYKFLKILTSKNEKENNAPHLSSYIISLVCPVVVILSIHSSRHPSCHPSSSSRKKKMMEEEDDDEWRPQQFIQMFMWSTELAREPNGGEELGPLRAMTATGAGLSLALHIAAASTYPSLAVILQPYVLFNSQQTL